MKELRQNTEALRLQAEQLEHRVEETRLLVKEANAQAKASADLVRHQAETAALDERRGMPRFDDVSVVRDRSFTKDPVESVLRVRFRMWAPRRQACEWQMPLPRHASTSVIPFTLLGTSERCAISFSFEAEAPQENAVPRRSRFVVKEGQCLVSHGERIGS